VCVSVSVCVHKLNFQPHTFQKWKWINLDMFVEISHNLLSDLEAAVLWYWLLPNDLCVKCCSPWLSYLEMGLQLFLGHWRCVLEGHCSIPLPFSFSCSLTHDVTSFIVPHTQAKIGCFAKGLEQKRSFNHGVERPKL
jgi:hypothetical protein